MKQKQAKAKVEAQARAQRGTAKRTLEVPADLKKALAKDKAAQALFDSLPPSHQREYVGWIEEAKKPETRAGRIAKTAVMLTAKTDAKGRR